MAADLAAVPAVLRPLAIAMVPEAAVEVAVGLAAQIEVEVEVEAAVAAPAEVVPAVASAVASAAAEAGAAETADPEGSVEDGAEVDRGAEEQRVEAADAMMTELEQHCDPRCVSSFASPCIGQ